MKMQDRGLFPVPSYTQPYWRSELHEIDSIRSTEQLPEECDILIIGAGLSGVSTAYHLLNDNPTPPDIVLLEAREICSGATGRNGGHLMMFHGYIEKVIKAHGVDTARELALFQQSNLYAMKSVVEIERLDCDAVLTRSMEAYLSESDAEDRKHVWEKQLESGLDFIKDFDFVDEKFVKNISGLKESHAAITTTALQLWPYKFVTGLLVRLVERTNINVQTRTRVTSVSRFKEYSIASTPRGSIRAKKVVFASNAYTAGLLPKYEKKIVPWRGTCSHIRVPKDTPYPPPHLNQTYGITYEAPDNRDYLIPRPDGGVICGGAKYTFEKDEGSYFNNWDDSTLIEAARPHFENVMQKNFTGWEQSGAAVDYLWTGIMGRTADGFPHCGLVPGEKDHYILAGFNGAGMSHIFLTAQGVAKMIRDDVPFQGTSIPSLFKATEDRLDEDVKA